MSFIEFSGTWPDKPILSQYLHDLYGKLIKDYAYGRVLEIGCSTGWISNYLEVDEYCGIDIDESAIRFGKQLHRRVQCLNFDRVGTAAYFNCVISCIVFNYFGDDFFKELDKALRMSERVILIERFSKVHPDDHINKIGIEELDKYNVVHKEKIDINFIRYLIHRGWPEQLIYLEKIFRKLQIFDSWYYFVVIDRDSS